jgi:hypothetical protein
VEARVHMGHTTWGGQDAVSMPNVKEGADWFYLGQLETI